MAKRLNIQLDALSSVPVEQSAYVRHHSMEIASIRICSEVLTAANNVDVSILARLDLSAEFVTMDY